jgi:enediyne biosynthesis protein E4
MMAFMIAISVSFISCKNKNVEEVASFEQIESSFSGIDFKNTLQYDHRLNAYTFRNFYNGAGVALGDINNDGLADIYFTGNLTDNKLYLNKGDFKFEDITQSAGVACTQTWSTGVAMADVNGDGWLDIFVCKSGPPLGGIRHNQLFINNGDLTFTDRATEWGVADVGLSLHAAFFDYDHDGDQDFYLLNNSNRSVGGFDLREGQRDISDPLGGNRLYRNDGNKFVDASKQAGIYTSAIGFGLGISIADVNKDGWQDIFISNDFFERDYLYINQQDGTFKESLANAMSEISMGSMGADIADINNDGYPEIFVTDMLPENLERVKTKINFESYDKYAENVKNGYHHQFNRNVLQLNMGPVPGDTTQVFFQEIGRYAGVAATDWSWGSLIFDYNNDGNKDIFVANGIAKDLLDQDYLNFYAPDVLQSANFGKDSTSILTLLDGMPSSPVNNYLFRNNGNLKFTNSAAHEGLDKPSFSNGAVYGDLNNDGALDLVVNNINQPAFIYKNLNPENNSFIQYDLRKNPNNVIANGAQVTVYASGNKYYSEISTGRGYLSSTDPRIHLGLGKATLIDSAEIRWPAGSCTYLYKQKVNQSITIQKSDAECVPCRAARLSKPVFEATHNSIHTKPVKQNDFIDFNRDRLLVDSYANRGTAIAQADVNGDGYQDLFIGGSAGIAGEIWIYNPQTEKYLMAESSQKVFETDASSEDSDAVFFDYNEDGLMDLFVASGSNIFSVGSYQLTNRLYLNQGNGNFLKSDNFIFGGTENLPTYFVKTLDFNKDGKTDLLLGHSFIPFRFGQSGSMQLLMRVEEGFVNATKQFAQSFEAAGMVTDAAIIDYDNDGDEDIIATGYWMGFGLYENRNGSYLKAIPLPGTENLSGLYNTVEVADVNHDSFPDLVVGNEGYNTLYPPSAENPWVLYVGDIDSNMNEEHVLCISKNGKEFPLAHYLDLAKQIPLVRKKAAGFNAYKSMSMVDLFGKEALAQSKRLEVTDLSSAVILNESGKRFSMIPLPSEAQFTKIYSILVTDYNSDAIPDLIIGGNNKLAKPEWGIQSASCAVLLKGEGNGEFTEVSPYIAGLFETGEIRQILEEKNSDKTGLIFLINNKSIKTYKVK